MLTLKVKEKDNPLPCGITFELYSAEEIRKMSVVQIITPLSMNATGQGLPGGLYDPLMGPHNQHGKCGTCQRNLSTCSGHFGHIELPLPVINPLFNKTVLQIFRLSCISCNSIIVPGAIKYLSIAQLKLLTAGLFNEALEAELIMSEIVAETEGDKGGGNRRKSTANTVADTEFARTTFEKFVKKKLKRHKKRKLNETHQPNEIINSSSTIIESIKQKTIKRILAYAKMQYKCQFCGTICKRMTQAESRILYSLSGAKLNKPGRPRKDRNEDDDEMDVDDSPVADLDPIDIPSQRYLTPIEAKKHLQCVWLKEQDFLEYMFPVIRSAQTEFPTDVFFIDVLCVTPPKNRPSQTVNNIHVEHPHNLALRHVVSSCAMIQYILRAMRHGAESLSIESQRAVKGVNGDSFQDKLENCWNDLQADVDHVFDRDRNSKSNQATSQMIGLKQIIEKKEGLFRMNMMGKRVNFAARTVITPDPNINIDEIGIPDEFAKVLTFPCTVTPANVYHLRQLILNGPLKYPGAVAVKDENGVLSRLHPTDQAKRDGFANRLLVSDTLTKSSFTGVKTVYRHLQNGDLLLLNRQPSLHRPSIMAHRARVLTGEKVFRLHYANCKHYNADFDGDEMNAHFPQDEESRAEAAALVNVCNHFLVPKDGTPLAGLIQDHIVGAVKLSIRGRFFTRDDYHQLVFFALSNHHLKIETEPPTILKPVFLWSGKQVVSTIIKNLVPKGKAPLSFVSTTKIKSNEWRQWESRPCTFGGSIKEDELSESVVIFQKGELICGVLDKQHLGATPYGLCHSFFELYGSQAVGSLLSAFSRLLTSFLQWEGFTLGIKDVLVMPGADELRRYIMVKASSVGPEAAAKAVGIPLDSSDELIMTNLETVHRSLDPKQRALVDLAYKQTLDKFTNKINGACLPYGLVTIFPANNLQLLVQSGAKGSTVNTMQMSCLLGQIELEGKRPPLTLAGKSLPSFKPYDMSPRAGGFILGRFLSGIRPQEFFFHCMAGREGLIDTAVKTSRSGYLQRCLVKLLEGVVTQYDMTVRDSDGTVIQFLYGEDGLDVSKSQFLKSKQLKFLEQNSNCVQSLKGTASRVSAMSEADQAELADRMDDVNFGKSQVKFWQDSSRRHEGKRGSEFLTFVKKNSKQFKSLRGFNSETGRSLKSEALIAKWQSLEDEDKDIYRKRSRRGPDPVLGKFSPTTMGVVSENLQKTLEDYTSDITFHDVVYSKAMEALSNPGDAVGVLAAQSIGEPSTQMTLNTFHFAGRGEMNVTLGIPRLREILMVASENIRTPCMDIPFHAHVTPEEAEALRIKLTRVSMSQVLENVEVTEKLDVRGHRIYQLKFRFLPFSEYGEDFYVKPNTILRYFEKDFLKSRLLVAFRRAQKLKKGSGGSAYLDATSADKIGGGGGKNAGGGDDEYGAGDDYDDDENGGGRKNNSTRPTNNKQLSESQVGDLYQEAEKKGQGEEHESSDEEAEGDDDDATQARRHARTTEREYEEPEEGERLDDPDDALSIADSTNSGRGRRDLEDDLDEDEENESPVASSDFGVDVEDGERRKRKFAVSRRNVELRRGNVLALDPLLHAYSFDTKHQEWAQVTIRTAAHADKVNMGLLLKEISERAVIHQVPSINRAFTSSDRGQIRLKTEGVNILAMCEYNHLLDLTKLHCNNIHTMARHYGIEAALKVLIKELTDVFKAYGIVIDPRHLSLIADYMTTSGIYRPFSRIGITSSTSPLHQMSFETVVTFLRDATLSGKRDDLQNPSSRLIVGKNVNVGTELFDCLTPKSGLANDPDLHRSGMSRSSSSSFAQSLFGDVNAKEEMKAKAKMNKKLSMFKLSQGGSGVNGGEGTPIIYS